ncbi:hypothetical protein SCHPADRAFT_792156, partial [Schizopora paradoxa]
LADVLSLLFEPSPILIEELVPQLASSFSSTPTSKHPKSYKELVDNAIAVVQSWDPDKQADFVKGHPRIGEVKVAMSSMSAAEQGHSQAGAGAATDPNVLKRLGFLNEVYEQRYPGLVYITFVNGRSRAVIAEEMEQKLVAEGIVLDMDKESGLDKVVPVERHGASWSAEVERAVVDVGRIAKSRLEKL